MTQRAAVFLALLIVLAAGPAAQPVAQQTTDQRTRWNLPFAPFHLIGNIQLVGTAGVSAFLIVTPEGSILLDGGLPETAPQIAANIAALGFRLRDVTFLLNSHAHFDHAVGLHRQLGAAALRGARHGTIAEVVSGFSSNICLTNHQFSARRQSDRAMEQFNAGLRSVLSAQKPVCATRIKRNQNDVGLDLL